MHANNPANRRYLKRFFPLIILYIAAVCGVSVWFNHGGPPAWLRVPVAILPALPIIGVVAAMGAYIVEQQDEYLRMLIIRQVLVAIGITLTITTAWGFLETFGLVAHIPAYATFILFCLGMIPSSIAQSLKERSARESN
jgi:hypothetical protein